MKKMICILSALCYLTALSSCGSSKSSGDSAKETSAVTEAASEESSETSASTEEDTSETTAATEAKDEPATAEKVDEETSENKADISAFEDLGNIGVDNQGAFVEITIPASLVSDNSLSDLDEDENIVSYNQNPDGSVTYKITKEYYNEALKEMQDGIDENIKELEEEDSTIKEITHDDSYLKYNVYVTSKQDFKKGEYLQMMIGLYVGMYCIFSGDDPDSFEIRYFDENGAEFTVE